MAGKSLRDRLIGAWTLVSYEERPVDGSESFFPMTKNPKGIIMYTPDGFMSAQLSKPDRKPFASGDWFKATDHEFKDEATSYIAYTGPFHVDEENQHLTHSMFISLFPNWIGQTQPRLVRIEGDRLFLSSATPISSSGKKVMSHLEWKRADASAMALAMGKDFGTSQGRFMRATETVPGEFAAAGAGQNLRCATAMHLPR